jgi:hypothetical protein
MAVLVTVRSASVWLAASFVFICSLSVNSAFAAPQHPAHSTSKSFPFACYFFTLGRDDQSVDHKDSAKESNYYKSVAEIYRLWCTPNASSTQAKLKAADSMADSWKLLWDEDEPYDTIFHEYGAIELLALMGITHQLPEPMVDDLKFTQMWMEECNNTCFTISSDMDDPAGQRYIIMQLRLRNDVFDNLKKEPASEPVIQMLWDARYRLVD